MSAFWAYAYRVTHRYYNIRRAVAMTHSKRRLSASVHSVQARQHVLEIKISKHFSGGGISIIKYRPFWTIAAEEV